MTQNICIVSNCTNNNCNTSKKSDFYLMVKYFHEITCYFKQIVIKKHYLIFEENNIFIDPYLVYAVNSEHRRKMTNKMKTIVKIK